MDADSRCVYLSRPDLSLLDARHIARTRIDCEARGVVAGRSRAATLGGLEYHSPVTIEASSHCGGPQWCCTLSVRRCGGTTKTKMAGLRAQTGLMGSGMQGPLRRDLNRALPFSFTPLEDHVTVITTQPFIRMQPHFTLHHVSSMCSPALRPIWPAKLGQHWA